MKQKDNIAHERDSLQHQVIDEQRALHKLIEEIEMLKTEKKV